ncbi:hypothetical protein BK653_08455 [Pseudomonas brassicacearum]|uniref:DUF4297 family anti-phage-associated protein n=1 Tax=Pseudomonas brassicacearum TaxID=930166 RepID=UPI000F47D1E0|nr:DUF4297 family anti-phage-associated protein [Pseudomonas brassicacearum]ROM71903.1 hypothetical protein BK653_08455 [Pseudomonas brassicacearum]
MSSREATEAITGYFYQFDKTILEILQSKKDDNIISVEGIEDIDITSPLEKTTIQCKYYAGTEYNHSIIKPAIIWMLKHFKSNDCKPMNYLLYGHYKSGQHKLKKLTIELLKESFLTTKKTRITENNKKESYIEKVHEDLQTTDAELKSFIDLLKINLYAPSFNQQYSDIISSLITELKVSHLEAELYHYSAALKTVRDLAIKDSLKDRSITKKDFIAKIKPKAELFDAWFIKRQGRDQYIKLIRSEKLARNLNTDPYDRFFVIDANGINNIAELSEVARTLAKNWGKLWARAENLSYCPALYFHGLIEEIYINLKHTLYKNNYKFTDGYPFKDSLLNPESFYTPRTKNNKIQLRLVNSLGDLDELIKKSSTVVEVYDFYIKKPLNINSKSKITHINIEHFDYMKGILK